MQAQDFAINLKDGLASFVHDSRVFTETEELLADYVAHGVTSLVMTEFSDYFSFSFRKFTATGQASLAAFSLPMP